jgi:hypothetical protein
MSTSLPCSFIMLIETFEGDSPNSSCVVMQPEQIAADRQQINIPVFMSCSVVDGDLLLYQLVQECDEGCRKSVTTKSRIPVLQNIAPPAKEGQRNSCRHSPSLSHREFQRTEYGNGGGLQTQVHEIVDIRRQQL